MSGRFGWGALSLVVSAGLLSAPAPVSAADFVVTKTADTNDGICDSDCSLREAIIAANALAGPDLVIFADLPGAPDVYSLSLAGRDEDASATGDLDVTDDLVLRGNGAGLTILQAGTDATNGIDRVLDLIGRNGVTLEIEHLTVRHGLARSEIPNVFAVGGGIASRAVNGVGHLVLRATEVFDNRAEGANGGGVHVATPFGSVDRSTLTLEGCTTVGNVSDLGGGGIDCVNCAADFAGVRMLSNVADTGSGIGFGGGGARAVGDRASAALTSLLIADNESGDGGAGLLFGGAGTFAVSEAILTGNQAIGTGGAVSVEPSLAAPAAGGLDVSLSRISGNGATGAAGISAGAASVRAENVWWGCDDFPGAPGCDSNDGLVDADPRLDLRLDAASTSIVEGETTLLTADVRFNSDGALVSPTVLNGLSIQFAADSLGLVAPPTGLVTAGTAVTAFTGLFVGNSEASATLDNGTEQILIAIAAGPDGDRDGVPDFRDNCPFVPNDQADEDENGIGTACQCGDVNGDGFTNVVDALEIARGQVGSGSAGFDHCDVDGEGSCNVADALAIARGQVGSAPEDQKCPAWGEPPVCGDGTCNGDEACDTCPGDCGVCSFCGDGTCDPEEGCLICAQDCGPCEICGDFRCSGGESCLSCPVDCGLCSFCGDLRCSGGESCLSCPIDCGPCFPF